VERAENGYGQYCPIAYAVEILGERWTLLIVRDMLVGATRFNGLARGLPGLSRSLLTKRLRRLEQAGLVERLDGEYLLTDCGKELEPIVFGLGGWGAKWVFDEPDPSELDAELLLWWIHTRLDISFLPSRRVVLHFVFDDDARQFWMVIERGEPSLCKTDPGFPIDVMVSSDTRTLYEVWLGRRPVVSAIRAETLRFDGQTALVRRMPDVMQLSPVAEIVRATGQRILD